jgi:nucleotide-binding universal stress UspA family protein
MSETKASRTAYDDVPKQGRKSLCVVAWRSQHRPMTSTAVRSNQRSTSRVARKSEHDVARPSVRHVATVLLATDLTPVSDDATNHAIDLAASLRARLLIVNVIDPSKRAPTSMPARVDQMRLEREPRLLEVVERARTWGVETTFLLWTGEVGRSIVAAAEAENADLIVVGTRGLARAGRWLLGSVSDHVVHHANCPVLVVR